MLEAEAKERQREAGKEHGRGMEKLVPELEQPISSSRSIQQAAQIMGIGKTYVGYAKTMQKPPLFLQ